MSTFFGLFFTFFQLKQECINFLVLTSITKYNELSGSRQQKCIVSQFQRLEGLKSSYQQSLAPSETCRGILPCLFPTCGGLLVWHSLVWKHTTPIFAFVITCVITYVAFSMYVHVSSHGRHLIRHQSHWIWRRKWQPSPVFLPGECLGQRGLEGYSPWSHRHD